MTPLADGSTSLLFAREDRGATLSDCGRYRYLLWRTWGDGPSVLFAMLNPSTADADADDPTIRRCVGFARRWGYGGIKVVNLYPWRATNPRDLPRGFEVFGEHPRGHDHNAVVIRQALEDGPPVIAAWGASPGPWTSQPRVVFDLLAAGRRPVYALGLTKDGSPRHPLYVRADAEPVIYRGPRHA